MSGRYYYGVAQGRNSGVYDSWDGCNEQVNGYSNARFRKFSCEQDAADYAAGKSGGEQNSYSSYSGSYPHVGSRNNDSYSRNNDNYSRNNDNSSSCGYNRQPNSRSSHHVVYTDGACSANGQYGAKAGYGVYWGKDHPANSYGPVHGAPTNNRAELQAVAEAIGSAIDNNIPKITVRTDSQHLIDSCDKYIRTWERNGWKTSEGGDVKNQDFHRQIRDLRGEVDVRFEKVVAHSGEPGNEAADALARKGAAQYR